jgi:hypothetical protein
MKRILLAVMLVFLFSPTARADVPGAPAPTPADAFVPDSSAAPSAAPERHWYGWQILLTDTAASLTWLGAAKSGLQPLYVLGAMIYVGGGPAIHFQHKHQDVVVPSLVARLAAPVVGVLGVIVVETSVCSPVTDGGFFYSSCQRKGAVAALLTPMLLTSIVDIAFARTPARDVPSAKTSDFAWAPTLAPTSGAGATLGFVGRF